MATEDMEVVARGKEVGGVNKCPGRKSKWKGGDRG